MKFSQLFTKTRKAVSQDEPSLNAQLLERAGYVSKLMSGVYTFLPLGLRVLNRVETIVREEMDALGAQEILMPALHPKEYWDKTGRWNTVDVLFKLKGSGDRDFALGATHEEIVTPLAKEWLQSYKDFPRAVYQIQTKFRNEARSKSGLLRGREFRMKDLYSFHANEEDLDAYYDIAIKAYTNIFKRCGLGEKTYLTYASGGTFSRYSHEFQTLSDVGEDTIYVCQACSVGVNSEIIADLGRCPQCSNTQLVERRSIEVGNIFKLMTRFSQAYDLTYTDTQDEQHPVIMGCYGIGTSRLVGTVVECSHDERGIIWPQELAPYDVHLIVLGQKPEDKAAADSLYAELEQHGISALYDDRMDISAGEKFADADLLGMPLRLVISAKTRAQDAIEVKARTSPTATLIARQELIGYVKRLRA